MDTFMDKLAQKFTAGEIIKANSAADMADVEKLKSQMEEYDQCLQEMRQVHLKNAENVEKLSALIEECMAKIAEVKNDSISTQDLEKRLEILLGANFDVKLSESMDSIREYIKQQNVDKEELAQSCYEKIIVDLEQQNAELENRLAQQTASLEMKVSNFSSAIDDKLVQVTGTIDDKLVQVTGTLDNKLVQVTGTLDDKLGQLDRTIDEKLAQQNESLNERLMQTSSSLEEKLITQQNVILESKLSQQQKTILEEMDGVRAHIAGRINEMKNARQDFSEIKTILENSKSTDQETMDNWLREIQDYVHKEDVKVYRNVQAVIVEHSEKNDEQLTGMNRRLTDGVNLTTKLAGGALALSAVSVILQLLIRLGIF